VYRLVRCLADLLLATTACKFTRMCRRAKIGPAWLVGEGILAEHRSPPGHGVLVQRRTSLPPTGVFSVARRYDPALDVFLVAELVVAEPRPVGGEDLRERMLRLRQPALLQSHPRQVVLPPSLGNAARTCVSACSASASRPLLGGWRVGHRVSASDVLAKLVRSRRALRRRTLGSANALPRQALGDERARHR
jgi:hypothetical protein